MPRRLASYGRAWSLEDARDEVLFSPSVGGRRSNVYSSPSRRSRGHQHRREMSRISTTGLKRGGRSRTGARSPAMTTGYRRSTRRSGIFMPQAPARTTIMSVADSEMREVIRESIYWRPKKDDLVDCGVANNGIPIYQCKPILRFNSLSKGHEDHLPVYRDTSSSEPPPDRPRVTSRSSKGSRASRRKRNPPQRSSKNRSNTHRTLQRGPYGASLSRPLSSGDAETSEEAMPDVIIRSPASDPMISDSSTRTPELIVPGGAKVAANSKNNELQATTRIVYRELKHQPGSDHDQTIRVVPSSSPANDPHSKYNNPSHSPTPTPTGASPPKMQITENNVKEVQQPHHLESRMTSRPHMVHIPPQHQQRITTLRSNPSRPPSISIPPAALTLPSTSSFAAHVGPADYLLKAPGSMSGSTMRFTPTSSPNQNQGNPTLRLLGQSPPTVAHGTPVTTFYSSPPLAPHRIPHHSIAPRHHHPPIITFQSTQRRPSMGPESSFTANRHHPQMIEPRVDSIRSGPRIIPDSLLERPPATKGLVTCQSSVTQGACSTAASTAVNSDGHTRSSLPTPIPESHDDEKPKTSARRSLRRRMGCCGGRGQTSSGESIVSIPENILRFDVNTPPGASNEDHHSSNVHGEMDEDDSGHCSENRTVLSSMTLASRWVPYNEAMHRPVPTTSSPQPIPIAPPPDYHPFYIPTSVRGEGLRNNNYQPSTHKMRIQQSGAPTRPSPRLEYGQAGGYPPATMMPGIKSINGIQSPTLTPSFLQGLSDLGKADTATWYGFVDTV